MGKSNGKYSNPSAVILMSAGEILHRADDAVIDWDDKAVGKLDDLLQELAHFAHDCAERARKVERIEIKYES